MLNRIRNNGAVGCCQACTNRDGLAVKTVGKENEPLGPGRSGRSNVTAVSLPEPPSTPGPAVHWSGSRQPRAGPRNRHVGSATETPALLRG